jgi:hypothetical protein
MTTFTVTAGSDHLTKLSRAGPLAALSELIWNGLDADAKKVSVIFHENKLDQVGEIVVVDDGKGLHRDDAETRFAQLGGSWKKSKGISDGGRFLHGSEGKGRFKALSLGRIATWNVVFNDFVQLQRYTIELRADIPNKIEIGPIKTAEKGARTGVSVRIEEVGKAKNTFVSQEALDELNETFATYLADYTDVIVEIDGVRLDPGPLIVSREVIALTPAMVDGQEWNATLDVIEWSEHDHRTLFLANERGAPLLKVNRKFHVGGAKFSAYLRSSYISYLQEQETLDLAELNATVVQWLNEAQEAIKEYFDQKEVNASQSLIQSWKEVEVYPFEGEPTNPVEVAERQVFDIVATQVAKHVQEYRAGTKQGQALHLRLLKNAIEKSPDELQRILSEVIGLPKRERARLADLLKDISLTSIINASAVVADRLKLIMGLQTILYEEDYKKNLRERTQLHRIIAQNAWLFGEEWSISVDDRSLTQVLKAHRQLLGDEVHIDEPVKHVSKTRGIVDLMLSRTIRRYGAKNPAHLVVELKAPNVVITSKEVDQIRGYARSVSEDPRFDKTGAEWDFWILSTKMDKDVRFQTEHNDGLLLDKPGFKIRVKVWSEVLEENRSRMQFYKELIEFDATEDKALSHLSERYAELLVGVLEVDDTAEDAAA